MKGKAKLKRKNVKTVKLLQYSLLIIVGVIMIFPIFWMIINSLKTLNGISEFPPKFFLKDPQWSNYIEVLKNPMTLAYFRNTLILIIGNTAGTLISSSIVAYPLARMEFKGRNTIFTIILLTMMVPTVTMIIPQFLLFRQFGWLDGFLPMIIPSFFAYPYNVFLFRQFFKTIPASIDEAAKIDGCSSFEIFLKIIVPISKPIFITVGILSAIFWWNELFQPMIFIDSEHLKPLALGALDSFKVSGGQNMTAWNLQMAFSVLMSIPPMILYIVASQFITTGIKTTGAKN